MNASTSLPGSARRPPSAARNVPRGGKGSGLKFVELGADFCQLRLKLLSQVGKDFLGKLNPADEGQLTIGVAVKDGTLIVNFNKPVKWLGFGYEDGKRFAEGILKRIEEIRQ